MTLNLHSVKIKANIHYILTKKEQEEIVTIFNSNQPNVQTIIHFRSSTGSGSVSVASGLFLRTSAGLSALIYPIIPIETRVPQVTCHSGSFV